MFSLAFVRAEVCIQNRILDVQTPALTVADYFPVLYIWLASSGFPTIQFVDKFAVLPAVFLRTVGAVFFGAYLSRPVFLPNHITILAKLPALPGRLPKFDISGNIRKPPIM